MEILETAAVVVSGLLIKKYVFLEPDMEAKKQRFFYLVSFFLLDIVFFAFGKDAATMAALFMIGLNICLGRKEHKLYGLFLMIPFTGIINGLLIPALLVPPYFFALSAQETIVYQYIFYGILAVLLFIFYVKGKDWRSWFQDYMKHRSLRKSEKYLLWAIGILLMFFSSTNSAAMQVVAGGNNAWTAEHIYSRGIVSYIGVSSISAFVMTITIIVLIMQGNKRSFYHEKVSRMQSGMITFMAEVVENRDDNTGGHIRRTAAYVECIAKELKRQGIYSNILTDRYVSDMVVAAPLHDIGKIHIPDAVLNKPGKLTEEEFEIMKTHTTAGEELLTHAKAELGESEYLNTAVEMAAYHHEWWNGKGYPYGISGEEIPLCARIMAVADVFDALTSKRCYKNAMPLEKAYAIIREESGTHFEPAVVEAFFAITANFSHPQTAGIL
ncbi:MAG: HD-GYP domain-containing protein [bacterium]|nr:HD-GYP domain-containing protein [bacterium]MCM1373803.1 HD-GYP domain-containing protein [Muribaculum sp.]